MILCDTLRKTEFYIYESSSKIIVLVTPAEKGKVMKCFAEGH